MSNLFWLTEAQMARLRPCFPKRHGRPRGDDLRMLGGIIFLNRNGLRWSGHDRHWFERLSESGPRTVQDAL